MRVSDPGVLGRLRRYLPPGWKPARSPIVDDLYSLIVGVSDDAPPDAPVRRYHLLYTGSIRLARTRDLDEALEALETYLHVNVALAARRYVFVNAGVVGWRGRAIVLPGPARSGKTEMVTALVRAGATYYSDTYAVFDAQGRVHPFAKPLTPWAGGSADLRKRVPVESLSGDPGMAPLPVGMIVATLYQKSGPAWRPRPLSPGEALLTLLENAIPARYEPDAALTALHAAAAGAAAALGGAPRGEAEGVACALLEHPAMAGAPA